MECKSKTFAIHAPNAPELIETLWNVNLIPPDLFRRGKEELIETLWNVNMKLLLVLLAVKQELIETVWNVNEATTN